MIDKKELLRTMSEDLRIMPYLNEKELDFQNRVLYTAMAEWVRAFVQDEMIDDFDGYKIKSKHYLTRKSNQQLKLILDVFEESRDYFNIDRKSYSSSLFRQRMLNVGELLELDKGNQLVRSMRERDITEEVTQVQGKIGCSLPLKKTGLTTISPIRSNSQNDFSLNVINPKKFLNDFIRNKHWDVYPHDSKHVEIWHKFKFIRNYSLQDNVIYLAQQPILYGSNVNYLLKKEADKIRSIEINKKLARIGEHFRLSIGAAVEVNINRVSYKKLDSAIMIKLPVRLPQMEMNLIHAFCWPLKNVNDSQNFIVPLEVWTLLQTVFVQLDFQLMEVR